jgi:hypothetical protein
MKLSQLEGRLVRYVLEPDGHERLLHVETVA